MPSADINARMYFDQGRASFARREYDQAADLFTRAVQADPKYGEAQRYLAESYEKLGYRHRARKAWEALLRITTDKAQQKEINDRLSALI